MVGWWGGVDMEVVGLGVLVSDIVSFGVLCFGIVGGGMVGVIMVITHKLLSLFL